MNSNAGNNKKEGDNVEKFVNRTEAKCSVLISFLPAVFLSKRRLVSNRNCSFARGRMIQSEYLRSGSMDVTKFLLKNQIICTICKKQTRFNSWPHKLVQTICQQVILNFAIAMICRFWGMDIICRYRFKGRRAKEDKISKLFFHFQRACNIGTALSLLTLVPGISGNLERVSS